MGNGNQIVGFNAVHRHALNWLDGDGDVLEHPADCSIAAVLMIDALDTIRAPGSDAPPLAGS